MTQMIELYDTHICPVDTQINEMYQHARHQFWLARTSKDVAFWKNRMALLAEKVSQKSLLSLQSQVDHYESLKTWE